MTVAIERSAVREVVYLYNCMRCKVGRRVAYQREGRLGGAYRMGADGARISSGVWIVTFGGGRPTVYGGDPLGVCDGCGRAMQFGQLQAYHCADVRCDARCEGARGFSCTCSCGGKNHGAAWGATS